MQVDVIERAGVRFAVEYEPAHNETPLHYQSLFLCDTSGRRYGPDLLGLMHEMVVITGENAQGYTLAEPFLSTIQAQLF
jgi:hypothetical protein